MQSTLTRLAKRPRGKTGSLSSGPGSILRKGVLVVENAWKIQAASYTTGSVTLNGNGTSAGPTAGNLMVVGITTTKGGTTPWPSYANHQVSDNIDGAVGWTMVPNGGIDINDTFGSQMCVSMWYKANVPSGITSMTASGGTNATVITAYIHEVSGASATPFTVGEVAVLSHTTGTPDTIPTGTITTATANSIIFAVECNGSGTNPTTQTVNYTGSNPTSPAWVLESSTYSQEVNGSSWWCGSMANVIVSSTVSNAKHIWDISVTIGLDASVIAAFH